jgi:carbon-monoxide dehydrogenase medium subunit
MKPAPFDYQAPSTLREAIDLLASNPEAFVIAGGQSLMPVLAFRLATPSLLVDLRRLPGLGNIAVGDDEAVRSRIQRTRALRRIKHGRVVHRGTKGSNPLSSSRRVCEPWVPQRRKSSLCCRQ